MKSKHTAAATAAVVIFPSLIVKFQKYFFQTTSLRKMYLSMIFLCLLILRRLHWQNRPVNESQFVGSVRGRMRWQSRARESAGLLHNNRRNAIYKFFWLYLRKTSVDILFRMKQKYFWKRRDCRVKYYWALCSTVFPSWELYNLFPISSSYYASAAAGSFVFGLSFRPSYSHECDISGTPSGSFFNLGSNVHLDLKWRDRSRTE